MDRGGINHGLSRSAGVTRVVLIALDSVSMDMSVYVCLYIYICSCVRVYVGLTCTACYSTIGR